MRDLEFLIDSETYKYKKAVRREEHDALFLKFLDSCRITSLFIESDVIGVGIGACPDAVTMIIEQVRRRKLYFHIYHDIEELSEPKETALYTFWILKLQPFFWRKDRDDRPNYELNAQVALYFFVKGLHFYADKKTKNSKNGKIYRVNISEDADMADMMHSFKFRDLSKEALMDLAENLIVEQEEIPVKTQVLQKPLPGRGYHPIP
jgi:hypothetical protein